MTEESLEELGAAFAGWRKSKRNAREPVPKALWEQTQRAAEIHGALAVSRVTKIQRSRIVERVEKSKSTGGLRCEADASSRSCKGSGDSTGRRSQVKSKGTAVPRFSRVSLSAPSVPGCPVAEVETAAGVRLRVFVQTEEMLNLLSSLCSTGGAR